MRYAHSRITKLQWHTKDGQARAGHDATDVAKEAMSRVFDGRRKWDPKTYPNIFEYLRSVVNSLISHSINAPGHVLQGVPSPGAESDEPVTEVETPDTITPIDHLIHKDLSEYLAKAAKGDEILEGIILCIECGVEKPADMAEELKVDIEEVYKARKRLRRIAEKYVNERPN